MQTLRSFSQVIGIKYKVLTKILYGNKVESYYRSFTIPKKSGGTRNIKAPTGYLLDVQKMISKYLSEIQEKNNNKYSFAFEKNKNIIKNASKHINRKFVINIDLKDFFESFTFPRVRGFFIKNKNFKYSPKLATKVANLVCYEGSLPQGAPTSPVITNLIARILDHKILSVVKKYNLFYTRYADDLTFSTNDFKIKDNYESFLHDINKVVTKFGFEINHTKTNIQYKDNRQTVTGLITNKKIGVPKEYKTTTRAMANELYKTETFTINGEEGDLNQLEGRFSYIDQVSKYNNKGKVKKTPYNLSSVEKDYQRFLFYKWFYLKSMPIIITEGITDIMYIKAALMNKYKDYPNLVTYDEKSKEFKFHIKFLNKNSKTSYFFNLSEGGNGYNYFLNLFKKSKHNKNVIPYNNIFNEIKGEVNKSPIIIIMDNELISKDKPLKTTLNYIGITNHETMKNDLIERSIKYDRIYILTNELADQQNESEMEDLFDSSILNVKIKGKSFQRNKQINSKTEFGKKVFAKYVIENYSRIDFSKFKTLLDNIDKINSGK